MSRREALCASFQAGVAFLYLGGSKKPRPGECFTYAEASYMSAYGEVKSSWKRENGKTVYTVVIPANCTAEIKFPGGGTESVAAGTYEMEVTAS